MSHFQTEQISSEDFMEGRFYVQKYPVMMWIGDKFSSFVCFSSALLPFWLFEGNRTDNTSSKWPFFTIRSSMRGGMLDWGGVQAQAREGLGGCSKPQIVVFVPEMPEGGTPAVVVLRLGSSDWSLDPAIDQSRGPNGVPRHWPPLP